MYLGITFLFMVVVPGFYCDEDIHKYMSPEEVQQIFHTDADSVPDYEIVEVHLSERLHKRSLPSGSHFHMRAFGEDINLWLHPRDSILAGINTPVYYAKGSQSENQAVKFTRRDGLMNMIGKIFEDPHKMASLVIGKEDSGKARVTGFIGSKGIVIKSLPRNVDAEYRKRRSISDHKDTSYHIVYKTNKDLDETYSFLPVNETRLHQRLSRSVTGVPETLYPEILVVVDYSVYKTFNTEHGHDIYRLLEYLLALWNGVDLKYRSLETPRIRLNIAAIVLAEDSQATPYIANHMVSETGFRYRRVISSAMRFHYDAEETFPLDSYDVAVTMTRLEFGVDYDMGVWGAAAPGTICNIDYKYKFYMSVMLFRDDGAFQGAHIAAHELAHVLGSHHDGQEHSPNCSFSDGFIMAFMVTYTYNSSDFSPCSMDQFQAKLDDGKYTCLYNEPKDPGTRLPAIMPGRMTSLEEQCKRVYLGAPCRNSNATSSLCLNIYCFESDGVCKQTTTSALDGTECEGENKFCLHQRCVSL